MPKLKVGSRRKLTPEEKAPLGLVIKDTIPKHLAWGSMDAPDLSAMQ
ncbi:9470_t:CDS:1, partial [Paraglomus occultum]